MGSMQKYWYKSEPEAESRDKPAIVGGGPDFLDSSVRGQKCLRHTCSGARVSGVFADWGS